MAAVQPSLPKVTPSGLAPVGDVAWGSHLCQFYASPDGLGEALVSYFAAGLRNNERCLWITSQLFDAVAARTALAAEVPDLQERIAAGQIEILNDADWYTQGGNLGPDEVLAAWLEREAQA